MELLEDACELTPEDLAAVVGGCGHRPVVADRRRHHHRHHHRRGERGGFGYAYGYDYDYDYDEDDDGRIIIID